MVKKQAEAQRDTVLGKLKDEARKRVDRMEVKMEDQHVEGGFTEALQQFIDDVVTFPTAILKGPIVRKRMTLKWNGTVLEPTEEMRPEWERVDPFKFYPAPWISNVSDGFLIERHQFTRMTTSTPVACASGLPLMWPRQKPRVKIPRTCASLTWWMPSSCGMW